MYRDMRIYMRTAVTVAVLTTVVLGALACSASEIEVTRVVELEVTREIEAPVEVTRVIEVPVEVTREVEVSNEDALPIEVEVTREIQVPVEVTREIEVPVEITREVEVTREVNMTRIVPLEVTKVVQVPVEVTREIEVPVEITREVEVTRVVVVTATLTPSPTSTPTPELPSTPAELLERVEQSVVQIYLRSGVGFFARKSGSGFIFAVEGTTAFVATNHHVIDGESSVEVQIGDHSVYDPLILGWDSERDVAVLSICCSTEFVALPWSQSAPVKGATVVAAGTTVGSTDLTGTIGEVSAPDDFSMEHGFISHSAPLNPGYSGGPLFSMPGAEVVGINTAGGTETLTFYAVPYQTIKDQVEEWRSQLVVLPAPTPTYTPTPTPTPTHTPTPISFGTVQGEDFSYTVHEVRDPVEPRFGVKAGHRLVAIDVTLEALHDDTVIHPWYFGMQDTDGYIHTPDWVSQVMEPELGYDYGNLPVNQKVRGWITLEVPQSAVLTTVLSFEFKSDRTVIIADLTRD